MRVYFVRHGESVSNAHAGNDPLDHSESHQLSEKGFRQARSLGKRLSHEGISRIVSSHYKRARQTADEIGKVLKLPVEVSPDIHEIVMSQEFYSAESPEARAKFRYRKVIGDNPDDPDFTLGSGESFSDLVSRVKKFDAFLRKHSAKDSLLIVGHNGFLSLFLGHILFGKEFSPRHLSMTKKFYLDNTGISIVEFRKKFVINGFDFSGWTVHTWNDVAHL